MTTIDDGLLIYLRLDAISAETTVLDRSGNQNNGTINGAPQLVPDDLFGSALLFDGASWIDLPPTSVPQGAEITVCFWASGAASLPGSGVSALGAQDASGHQILDIQLPWSDSAIRFACGYASNGFDQLQQAATAADFAGSWQFWAMTKNTASGTMQISLNGNLWASASGQTRPLPAAAQALFGAAASGAAAYKGKLSSLRIYDRVLSAAEIWQVMAADPAAAAAFASTSPLSFYLLDDDGHAIISIDDDPTGHNLFLTLSNTSRDTIELATASAPATAANHHIALNFRPGTLSTATLAAISVADATWDIAAGQLADGGSSIYLLSTQARMLAPDQSINLTLQSISAAASSGARNTRVELTYQQLQYSGSPTPLTGSRLQNLVALNSQGASAPPLHVGFVGPNIILNDGSSVNALTLRLTNLLDDAALALSPSTSAEPTTLILTFDVQDSHEQKDWALGTTSQVNGIGVAIANWAVRKDPEEAEWIGTTTQTALAADGFIEIALTQIISSLPAGTANLYLLYENLPGYRDGYFIVAIEKSPLVYTTEQRVGIGTNQPNRPLAIRGAGSNEETLSFENSAGQTKWHINQKPGSQAAFNIAETSVADGRLFLKAGGNTGIGTITPRTGLDTGLGVLSGAANDYIKAQWTLSGGGRVSWAGVNGRLKWTVRFIAVSAERPKTFAAGYVDIAPPTADIPAANVYDGAARSANADGVVLKAWEALYAVHTVGGSNTALSLRIVSYTTPTFYAPSNWLLVAVVNGDDGTIKLGTGVVLSAKTTSLNGSPIPSGTLLMWSGASNAIPGGWLLCNGQNGTPDLRDRFIVGAGSSYAVGATGGQASVQLTISQLPAHSHAASVSSNGNHNHSVYFDTGSGGSGPNGDMAKSDNGLQQGVSANFNMNTSSDGSHSHTVSIQNAGGSQPHENRPPFYALCYIVKQ